MRSDYVLYIIAIIFLVIAGAFVASLVPGYTLEEAFETTLTVTVIFTLLGIISAAVGYSARPKAFMPPPPLKPTPAMHPEETPPPPPPTSRPVEEIVQPEPQPAPSPEPSPPAVAPSAEPEQAMKPPEEEKPKPARRRRRKKAQPPTS